MASPPSGPSRRTLPIFLAAGAILILVALLAGDRLGRVGEGAFAVSAVLFPVLLIALGTRSARPGLRAPLVALGTVLVLSALGIVLLDARGTTGRLLLGLPPAAWLALAGLGLVPFILVLWSYVATFEPPRERARRRQHDSERSHG